MLSTNGCMLSSENKTDIILPFSFCQFTFPHDFQAQLIELILGKTMAADCGSCGYGINKDHKNGDL
jgi:hypothetical protein